MNRFNKIFNKVAKVQIFLYLIVVFLTSCPSAIAAPVAATVPAASSASVHTNVAPAAGSASVARSVGGNLTSIGNDIHILKGQINTLNSNINAVNNAAKPVIAAGNTIAAKVNSYPDRVTAFRQKYGVPLNNPSLDDEWAGLQRYLLRKGGMSPRQADIMAAKMAKTPVMEHLKQPFRPTSIATAVGITAGLNMLKQVRSGEKANLVDAMSFIKDKTYWSGMMASGVCYALSSYVAAAVLPPGVGVVAALVPTFAGMLGSAFGWEIGTANGKPIGEVLKNLDFAQMVGQAAGSSLGIILGGQLSMVMFASLGTIAGPLGAIAGALILGPVGAKIAGFVRDFIFGDKEALQKAGAEVKTLVKKTTKIVGALEDHGYLPAAEAIANLPSTPGTSDLKTKYSQLYTGFLDAHNGNRPMEALDLLRELRATKKLLDAKIAASQ